MIVSGSSIATYVPQRELESAAALNGIETHGPPATPKQLAELSRALQLLDAPPEKPAWKNHSPDGTKVWAQPVEP